MTELEKAALLGRLDPEHTKAIVEPSHYHQGVVDPLDLIAAAGDDKGFVRGSLIKYVHRFEDKDDPEGDLTKAAFYLGWLIGIQSGQDVEGRRRLATLMADVAKGGME